MVGKRFSGPDTAYPHLQHNTTPEHNHERYALVGKKERFSPHLVRCLLPATSAEEKPRIFHPALLPNQESDQPAEPSRENLAILVLRRERCPGQGAGEQGISPKVVALLDAPRTPFVARRRAVPGLEFPATCSRLPRAANQPPPRRGDQPGGPRVSFTIQRIWALMHPA